MLERGGFEYLHGVPRAGGLRVTNHGRATGVTAQTPDGERRLDADVVIDASGAQLRGSIPGSSWPACFLRRVPKATSMRHLLHLALLPPSGRPRLPHDGRPAIPGRGRAGHRSRLSEGGALPQRQPHLLADPGSRPRGPAHGAPSVTHAGGFDTAAERYRGLRCHGSPDDRAEPISKVYRHGNLANTRRHFLVDDRPLLANFFAIGDAHVHTNPIAGRGCALAWVSAFALTDALTEYEDPDGPRRARSRQPWSAM